MKYENNRPYFNLKYEGGFDNLIKVCPSSAIRYDSEEYDIDKLIEKIKEDQIFFRDDGGVTFSGGEPLMQGEFLTTILKKCKEEGIHTAIETTLYASLDLIKDILPYLDLIYVDLKVFDYVWLSCELKCSKPNEKVYKIVEKDCNISPNNILFIDDVQKNLEPAKERGWNTCNAYGYELDKIRNSVEKFINE